MIKKNKSGEINISKLVLLINNYRDNKKFSIQFLYMIGILISCLTVGNILANFISKLGISQHQKKIINTDTRKNNYNNFKSDTLIITNKGG